MRNIQNNARQRINFSKGAGMMIEGAGAVEEQKE
jgi:hypothetical protein